MSHEMRSGGKDFVFTGKKPREFPPGYSAGHSVRNMNILEQLGMIHHKKTNTQKQGELLYGKTCKPVQSTDCPD